MERSDNSAIWLGPLKDVAAGLSARSGYAPERALAIATEIGRLDWSLHEDFRRWWASGSMPDGPSIMGYTPKRLIEQGRCQSIPVAFTWLSALVTNAQRTQELLQAKYDIIAVTPGGSADQVDARFQ